MEVGGRRILDRVIDAVAAATGAAPLLVANAPDAAAWRRDLHTIPDTRPGLGSLGGIYTAVTAGPGPVLAVAWDMPFVTSELLQALVEGSAGWDVFLPESDGRRASVCGSTATRQRRAQHAAGQLLRRCGPADCALRHIADTHALCRPR